MTHYLLGHADSELRRLDLQGLLYHDVTRRALMDAGVAPGMRVLDVGCGTGDVSMVAAEIVGPDGSVLGVDRGEPALRAARAKADRLGLSHADFQAREIAELDPSAAFDALVGRFVLMHQPRPAEVLRAAAGAVRPGGVVVMIESWMELLLEGVHSEPHSPLYDRVVRFQCEVVRRAEADLRAGGRLRATFLDAGLPAPACRLETPLAGGPDSLYYEYVAESVRSMLPEAARTTVSGIDPDEVDGLAERLRAEVVASGGVLLVWPVVSAFTRT